MLYVFMYNQQEPHSKPPGNEPLPFKQIVVLVTCFELRVQLLMMGSNYINSPPTHSARIFDYKLVW